MYILGISAFYHDSAAALLKDGDIVAAAQEERFTRKKHDASFPVNAAQYCLQEAGIGPSDLDYVGFYDKPIVKFFRLLETYVGIAPAGYPSYVKAIPQWLIQKLWMKSEIQKQLEYEGEILFGDHHESHAASAFYPSPFDEAAILTIDGVGEWSTSTLGVGEGKKLEILKEIRFPHSLGLLYSAFTYYTGFRVNSGEYKVMGLASYGEPKYVDLILDNIVDLKEDGSFHLDQSYFNYMGGLTMTSRKFHDLFGAPPRTPETKLTQREMDIAHSCQVVTEEIMLRMARTAHKVTGKPNLCLAGGCALNCVANGRILREGPFEKVWIQPAAGDAGGALGVAYAIHHRYLDQDRLEIPEGRLDRMKGAYLGPSWTNDQIREYLDKKEAPYDELDEDELIEEVAGLIADENVIGWYQGRMEFGPRALGDRSIIGDARSPDMQRKMNLQIKFRESFRPFAPSCMEEHVSDWFDHDRESPYMLLVADVHKDKQKEMTEEQQKLFGIEKLNIPRSEIPAVTHVDYSARIQTVREADNPRYYRLIKKFYEKTGCPVVINTSFNVRGEPIVCAPEHAYLCFMRTNMDYLVMGNFLLAKKQQKELEEDVDWRKEFVLD